MAWVAEDAPNLPPGFQPENEEHAAMIATRVLYRGESEYSAKQALLNDLRICSDFRHVREAGEVEIYATAARAIAFGLTREVRIHYRIWRMRETGV